MGTKEAGGKEPPAVDWTKAEEWMWEESQDAGARGAWLEAQVKRLRGADMDCHEGPFKVTPAPEDGLHDVMQKVNDHGAWITIGRFSNKNDAIRFARLALAPDQEET